MSNHIGARPGQTPRWSQNISDYGIVPGLGLLPGQVVKVMDDFSGRPLHKNDLVTLVQLNRSWTETVTHLCAEMNDTISKRERVESWDVLTGNGVLTDITVSKGDIEVLS